MKLILVRGLPGSGKSTIAKSMEGVVHMETDFFWGSDYQFNIGRIKEAHAWCQSEVYAYLSQGRDVVVANTFTTKMELLPYFELAKKFNIVPHVILCQNRWDNVHNVPQETLDRMSARFEYDISELFQ